MDHVIYFYFLFSAFLNREKSLRHVAMAAIYLDLKKPWSSKTGRKFEKIGLYDFPVHDCTQEQNSSPYFSSFVRMQMTVSVKKDCWDPEIWLPLMVNGNVTSHSPLYW